MFKIAIAIALMLGAIFSIPASAQYRGALMNLTTPQVVPGSYYGSSPLYPQYGHTVRDTDGMIDNDPASPGYRRDMIIPAGVSLVEFTCSMVMDAVPEDTARAQVLVIRLINGGPGYQFPIGVQPSNGRTTTYTTSDWGARTGALDVVPGERYRCQLWQVRGPNAGGPGQDGAASISSVPGNWFQATIIQ